MRLIHLTDDEIQVYLDRWTPRRAGKLVRQEMASADQETLEHLDRCPRCAAELHSYRELYGRLVQSPEVRLPRGFARRVTWLLPPFAAMRTRLRLRALLSAASAAGLALIWLLCRLDWAALVSQMLAAADSIHGLAGVAAASAAAFLPQPAIDFPDFAALGAQLLRTIQRVFLAGSGLARLALMAFLALGLVGGVDRLCRAVARREQTNG